MKSIIYFESNTIFISSEDREEKSYFVIYNLDSKNWTKYQIDKEEWSRNESPYIEKINFVNKDIGYACGWVNKSDFVIKSDVIYKTTDGGTSWNLQLNETTTPFTGLNDIEFSDVDNGIAVGFVISNV